jgi:hypothetical protein
MEAAGLAAAAVIDFKLPLTIQTGPIWADKTGAGVFASWNIHVNTSFFGRR